MKKRGGRNEDDGSSRELEDELEVVQDQVSPARMVELPERLNGTPPKWAVHAVAVRVAHHLWPKVDRNARPNATSKVSLEVTKSWVGEQSIQSLAIV